ncbi:MAG: hypothetical protein JXJ17_14170 [Anaerolineae bacterium]|nr:hypothetical protein [Anaerolineae bacterium]
MARYIFSNGRVQVTDDEVLRPKKRQSPLRSAVLFIITPSDTGKRIVRPLQPKEPPDDRAA